MKLLAKTNWYYLIFLVALAPIMIGMDYFITRYFVNIEVNRILEHESDRIQFYLEKEGFLPYSNYLVRVDSIRGSMEKIDQFRDSLIYEAYTNKTVPYRYYTFSVVRNDTQLKISLRHILLEMNELIVWIFATTSLILIILGLGLFFINIRISKWAWKPFHSNLQKLKKYNVSQKQEVQLEASDIIEFESFNAVLKSLIEQVRKDFQNLKEFNENISHEIQTPLAVIRNKMVLLLESQHLGERELQWVQSAYQEANKLSKIGKSLILISRIENQEFTRLEDVHVEATINNILSNMEELIEFKKLELKAELETVIIKCDPILANILFTNLIKNAIQHNQEGGYIYLKLSENKFEIENTGDVLNTDTEDLFNRFQKGNKTSDSLGLGLAINKNICDLYGYVLEYEHNSGRHKFILSFEHSRD